MKWLTGLCGLVGIVIITFGLWIPAKATLAQWLIEQAWQESRNENSVVKPWPWFDTHPVARLWVPRLGVSRLVLSGMSGQALAFGPGLQSSEAPIEPAQAVMLAGHNDTHFRFLDELEEGGVIHLELHRGSRRYRVLASRVLDVRDDPIVIDSREQVLLVTCYPFDVRATNGPLRFVVTAVRLGD